MQDLLPFDRLKLKQRTALIALLRGSDDGQAAKEAGVSVRSIRRWRKLPDFEAARRAAIVDFYSACRSQVVAAHAEAFEALRKMARYSSTPGDTVRSSMFLVDYLARPDLAESLARREAKTHHFNKLTQLAPGKAGQTCPSDTNSQPLASDSDNPADDAG